MDVPGGCLEVTEVSQDDGGFEAGVITASRLNANFDFESVGSGFQVPSSRVWPRGPFILVRFRTTAQFADLFRVLTVAELRSVSSFHAASLSRVALKSDDMQFLRSHECQHQCAIHLVFVFKAREFARRRQSGRKIDTSQGGGSFASTSADVRSSVRHTDVSSVRSENNDSLALSHGVDTFNEGAFPFFPTKDFRNQMILAWQE
jgi:hypothetical protein